MKRYYIAMFLAAATIFAACNDSDIPSANFNLQEVVSVGATPDDMAVTVSWVAPEAQTQPTGYCIKWMPGEGSTTVDGTQSSAYVEKLENGVNYTFAVHAIYGKKGTSGAKKVNCSPVSSRVEATDVTLAAGDKKMRLSWTRPATSKLTGYVLTLVPGNVRHEITNPDVESYVFDALTNGITYTATITCVYTTGNSSGVSKEATPGTIIPMQSSRNYIAAGESASFSYNEMYFMGDIESQKWTFGDGQSSAEKSPSHIFASIGKYTVSIEVTYVGGTKQSESLDFYVMGYSWECKLNQANSVVGAVKTSSPAYAADGTIYISLSGPGTAGYLYAVNPDGSVKWVFDQMGGITYGGGPTLAADGTIYTATQDKKLYAVKPDGTLKWAFTASDKMDCYPVVGADGTIYVMANGANCTLYAISASGSEVWEKSLSGAAGSMAIDKAGVIYAGTASTIYAFSADGTELWNVPGKVTERGTMAVSKGVLYAGQKAGSGMVALNTANGSLKWSFPLPDDTYSPVIGKDGAIYFGTKAATNPKYFYALTPDGDLKWRFNTKERAMIYSTPAIDSRGIIYFGTQQDAASPKRSAIYAVDTKDGSMVWEMIRTDIGKVQAGASISPAGVLHMGTIGNTSEPGALLAIPIHAGPETSSWSCRGGNSAADGRER